MLNYFCSFLTYSIHKHFKSLGVLLILSTFLFTTYVFAQDGIVQDAQNTRKISTKASMVKGEPKGPPKDISKIPLPKARGFWGTFFFWSGGVLAMYLVGRKVFKEQAHERRTLKRFRDELGQFFPEFDPINIKKWVEIAAPHLYQGWRENDFSSMESFTSSEFMTTQAEQSQHTLDKQQQRVAHLDKIIAVHTLGATWEKDEQNEQLHPPLGVKLTLRVEAKAIDFIEDQEGQLISGKKKPEQFQQIWNLVHNGKTWTLNEVYETAGDITHLSEQEPLPVIAEWRRPETVS